MDIQLARTFLAIIADGNFGSAATSLFITQSAVSLRIKRLEETLGQRLFERSKGGVFLTPAGQRFERYAISMVRIWEEARHQIGASDGYARRLTVGGQYSLLPRLVNRWITRLEDRLPDVSFRLEAGMPERLIRQMIEGTLDIAVLYMPQLRPGIIVEQLFEEKLVLVSGDPEQTIELGERYVFADWGPEFSAQHGMEFPDLPLPRLTFAIGTLGINFIIREKRACFLPARAVAEYIERGELFLVPNAPTFNYPCYVAYSSALDRDMVDVALAELNQLAETLDDQQSQIIEILNALDN